MSIENGLNVHSCSISDPHIVLLLSDSSLQLITLECGTNDVESEQDKSVRITSASPSLDPVRENVVTVRPIYNDTFYLYNSLYCGTGVFSCTQYIVIVGLQQQTVYNGGLNEGTYMK